MLDALLSPLDLGPVRLANRVVSTSHQTSLVHEHLPTDDLIAYHEARARGGVGLIVTEATAVHPTGLLTAHTVGGYLPDIVPVYRRLAAAVQPHGTRLVAQLFHGGRELISAGARPPAVAPSSIPSARFRTEPRELTTTEIGELVEGFGAAAAYAAEGGLDGVEICAGFGYLATQFLSRHTNRRIDAYGGDLEGRMRFLREVLAAMREGIAGGAVGVRLTDESQSPDGTDEEDVLAAIATLSREGVVDYVSVALGSSSTYRGSTYIVPPSPVPRNAVAGLARRAREASGAPVIATGRVLDPADADAMVRRGDCDAVGMTRALIADPALVRKAAAGRPPNRCIGCNQGCIGHYHAGLPIACTVNPWTGYERRLPRPSPNGAGETVVVVGAGPAGCAAAASAVASGRRAVVFERGTAPGGQMRLALAAPGHRDVAESLVENLGRWLGGAELRTGVSADAPAVLAEHPQRVVLASGAEPYRPALAGDGLPVLDAWEVLAGAEAGAHPLVYDWGGDWSGLDAAEALAARGAAVRLVTSAVAFGEAVHQYQRNLYLARLDEAGVELLHHLRPVGVAPGAVELRNVFSERSVTLDGVDALVVAAGRRVENNLYLALREHGLQVARVGDANGPRGLEEAIREGTAAGMGLAASTVV